MASTPESPERQPQPFHTRVGWPLLIALLILIGVLILLTPRLAFWYSVHWGYESLKQLFYQDLALSDSLSSFLATALSFFYALAWLPLVYLTYRLFRRMDARKIAVAFVAYLFIYGLAPLLEGVFGTDICFNQATGEAQKWYVLHRDGSITLFDSPGFDSNGVAKKPVTTEICQIFEFQKNGTRAHQLTGDPRNLEFFRADNGAARVWYDTAPDGTIRLFDGPGFDPDSSDPLHPVTKQIVAKLVNDLKTADEAAEAARKQAEEQAEQEAKQEKEELAARCFSTAPCSLVLQSDGITEPVAVPPGKNTCFDPSFWKNLDSLGYQTSYRGSAYASFLCTREQVVSRTCDVKFYDHFRFTPQDGVSLPTYWFIPAGTRKC